MNREKYWQCDHCGTVHDMKRDAKECCTGETSAVEKRDGYVIEYNNE